MDGLDVQLDFAPDFDELVVGSETVKRGFELQTTVLPQFARTNGIEKVAAAISDAIISHYRLPLFRDLFSDAELNLREYSHIETLADKTIPIPTFAFTDKGNYFQFLQAIGVDIENPPQAISVAVPWHILLRQFGIEGGEDTARHLFVVIYCGDQFHPTVTPAQDLFQETIHSIDPLIQEREGLDSLILNKLIVVVAELAGHETADFSGNHTASIAFWEAQFVRLGRLFPALLQILPINPAFHKLHARNLATAMRYFLLGLLAKKRDMDLVRILMSCRGMDDLKDRLKDVWPEKYWMDDSAVDRRAVDMSVDFYNRLHDSVRLGNRRLTVTSTSPQEHDQLMAAFYEANLRSGILALESIQAASGHAFDFTNVRGFRIMGGSDDGRFITQVLW